MDISSVQTSHLPEQTGQKATENNNFGFFDLIDMLNPLHHIPVIGTIYRAITGDEIKPVSNIIGGAVYGGPAGAAIGVVNAIAKNETGEDVLGNISALAFSNKQDKPENYNLEINAYNDLPVSLLSFAQKPLTTSENTEIPRQPYYNS
ncbi:MAG: hypothetical protein ACRBDL_08400 [Alphaproteobacteria bacterium]